MGFISKAILLATVAGALIVPAPATADACNYFSVETYDVRVKPDAKVYDLGDTARVDVTVTRKATGEPVPDANAAIAIFRGKDGYAFGMRRTDDDGKVTVPIKLDRRNVRPGPQTLIAYAYTTPVDTVCARVSEYGYKKVPGAFRVRD